MCQEHPVLGKIIAENPEVFSEENRNDWEQLCLSLLLMFEWQKGEESFWKPYLDLMPEVEFFCDWPQNLLIDTQDFGVIRYTAEYKDELEEEWASLVACLSKYSPSIFAHKTLDKQLWKRLYA